MGFFFFAALFDIFGNRPSGSHTSSRHRAAKESLMCCQGILQVYGVASESRLGVAWDRRPWKHVRTYTPVDEHEGIYLEMCIWGKGGFLLSWECGYLNVCL